MTARRGFSAKSEQCFLMALAFTHIDCKMYLSKKYAFVQISNCFCPAKIKRTARKLMPPFALTHI